MLAYITLSKINPLIIKFEPILQGIVCSNSKGIFKLKLSVGKWVDSVNNSGMLLDTARTNKGLLSYSYIDPLFCTF